MSYSMKEVCQILGLPSSTIRYYDKEGLLPFMERTEGGYRQFSDADVGLLKIIECLKRTGMPIKDIKQFTIWVQQGDASLKERHEMFLERKRAVEAQMAQLQETMKVIEYKCWYYQTALEAGTESVHQSCSSCSTK